MEQIFSADRLSAEMDNLYNWIVKRIDILGFKSTDFDENSINKQAIFDFISGQESKTLSLFHDEVSDRITLRSDIINATAINLSGIKGYFIRSNQSVLTAESVHKSIIYGTIGGSGLSIATLERFMKGLVEKQISSNNELSWHYHRLMATLTDTIHSSDNRTMLYCPHFEFKSIVEAAQDKDKLQIMESIVIHWTRQIKDVVNSHENSASAESSGPLDEIEFWKVRAEDLLGIQKQLEVDTVSRIIEVLEYAKSNYIGPFHNRTQEILTRASEANDNLKFLETIRDQCTALRTIDADKLVSILPDLLNRIRLIWTYSSYYSSNDHICGILRKISNEIIRRFRSYIKVEKVIDGNVEASISRLLQAIECGTQWKSLYHITANAIDRQKATKHNNYIWNMDDASIFAQIDAFVQRCRDLVDVCECQIQFIRKSAVTKNLPGPLPRFGGTKAQEIVDGILGIQASFEQRVDRLRKLDYDILDVRISKWHEDYHSFKNNVKDLEVMYTNVINAAFDNNSTVSEGVILTETFQILAKRELIKRCVERKASEVLQLFMKQVQNCRSEFELSRLNPPLRMQEPQYAGSALWAQSLAVIVKESYDMMIRLKDMLDIRDYEESCEAYTTLITVIKDFKLSRYNIWLEDLTEKAKDNGLYIRLDKTLLRRVESSSDTSSSKTGIEILSNFDEYLLSVFSEVTHWEKFHGDFTIPYIAHDICNKKENLRIMRENVMLLVRAYNDIVHDINADERRLFIDHIRKLDRKISPGLNKITWQSRNLIDIYVRECCNSCHELSYIINEYKDGKVMIHRICKMISMTMLVKFDKNQVYEGDIFEAKQHDVRLNVVKMFDGYYRKIMMVLKNVFRNFKDGPTEVQREWKSQIVQFDKLVEQSLKQAVKRSLQELSKAINGDSKTDPITLFTVQITLEGSSKVIYTPSMINLSQSLNIVAKEVISTVTAIHRIRGQVFDTSSTSSASHHMTSSSNPVISDMNPIHDVHVPAVSPSNQASHHQALPTGPILTLSNPSHEDKNKSYYDMISEDSDILRLVVQVMNGMSSTATELQKYLSYWDKYKTLWEMDKESYIKKYAKGNKTPLQYDGEITRYRSLQAEVYGETGAYIINFVRVDCNSLKENLITHCLTVQNKLTNLLNQTGLAELQDIHEIFHKSKDNLTSPPSNLDELSAKITLCKELKDQLPSIQERFDPVREIYNTLEKFEVALKEEEMMMLLGLDNVYDEFGVTLIDAEKLLDRSKVTMKRDLEVQMDTYGSQMIELKTQAMLELPYDNTMIKDPKDALVIIEAFKAKIIKAKEREQALTSGLSIFGIPSNEHKDLSSVVKDVDFMAHIWNITIEWNNHWNSWKTGQFNDLDVEEMEVEVNNYSKKVSKLGRDIRKWKVWETMKEELDRFKETIPLVQDLRNKALRSRHWIMLQDRIGFEIDHDSIDFTLNEVMKLKLNLHKDFISDLSSNANKELAIEVALNDLESRWSQVQLDIGSYKDKYYKLKSVDDITQFLEDDSVALSTMKASKFYTSFAYRIDDWEHALSIISEVIESILAVQRKWIYLESIFNSGGDISKQLPTESSLFRSIDDDFLHVMTSFSINPIAKQSCLQAGLLDRISSMDERLERIQKSLDQYLEKKRMIFPRFYFVSDDDLLEILGQSKDPIAVQKHIKKCFEGIKNLKLSNNNSNNNTSGAPSKAGSIIISNVYEASHMNSHDGEVAPFVENVMIDGPVELWLVQVEKSMRRGINKLLSISCNTFKGKKEKWVKETIGQLLITTGAIMWTADCNRALMNIASGSKSAMRQQKKKQVSYLNKLTAMIRTSLSKVERNKVVALITMEIHNRDVIERMVKANCMSIADFEWLSQLRFIYNKELSEFGKCEVRQLNSVLEYSYEYQGNNGRLVVTPLTDRCVLTLITAMYLNRGGNPLGPAGTGKTETVKDLGKNLAKYVVVINCSDGMDYKSVGRIFSGLVQSGSWGCFDEFNRIKIEVISVVAMQILSILNALSSKVSSFSFMGTTIPCNPNCGIFITMNPGYAGRTELPDNLKALMRPVAMMAPDLTMIAEVMLASEGFNEARIMAKKTVTLYSLMIQQLSKQDHYDYGLRNLKAVLNMAGQLKRSDNSISEEAILMRALRDMNLPKFILDDERLFRLLLGDLFPSLELAVSEYGTLRHAIEVELDKNNLQRHEFLIQKIFQFYDSRLTRHCNMLVGDPMGGKSTAWKILAAAQTSLYKQNIDGYLPVTPYIINPKSIELDELYGAYDLTTFEWKDGILSTIFKSCSEDEKPVEKWILFDGPIDAMWIESMNSVMDDNKILTLINGDRIPLTNTMSLVFETQDLRVASPATVSRAGMIYIDANELGWRTYMESWLKTTYIDHDDEQSFYRDLFEKWIPRVLKFKGENCIEPVKVSDYCSVTNLCSLFVTICKQEIGFTKELLGNDYHAVAEKLFLFAITWSIGATVDEAGRKKMSICFNDIDGIGPVANTIYDYYVDVSKNDFIAWETKVPSWRLLKGSSFHDMIVPTVDTTRNSYIAESLISMKKNTMFVGATGTGKTILAQCILKDLSEEYVELSMNFSAATSSSSTQDIIESSMEKRSKDKLGPVGGKKLIIFIDDFNMPKLSSRESPFQPPLELIRMWIDYQGWYDRSKCTWRYILDSQLVVAMGHPGGGRNTVCQRTQSRFSIINFTFPSDSQIVRIFESILSSKFGDFENDIKMLTSGIAIATLNTYKSVCNDFLPTPEKFHYQFNIRDVAKVIQGIIMANRKTIYTPEGLLRLWIHECQRVFSDRFIQSKSNDEQKFRDILSSKMSESLQKDWNTIINDCLDPKTGPLFCGYLQDHHDDEEIIYEEVTDYKKIRSCIEEKLDDYNLEPKLISMNLAMFKDAIMHVSRIHRVLIQARGNLMLIGVGGSGRSSLARLASYMLNMNIFTIEITKNYRLIEFREDIKKLYMACGCENKKMVFLFNDTQIKDESFLEDINNLLSSGVIPNLFQKDEYPMIYDSVRKAAVAVGVEDTPINLYKYFINRVRNNLHIILAMSPIGETLRNRCRMYPGLVNCTTIDYFHRWPNEALQEVAMKFLSTVEFNDVSIRPKISSVFADMHISVINASTRMLSEHRRYNYVTPMNYLELVKGYATLLDEKRKELSSSANKLANGLAKLEDAKCQVESLSKELEVKKVIVAQSQKDCEDLLVQIVSERRVADEQRRHVEADSERISLEAAECKAISDDAENELSVALPALERAMEEVDRLDKNAVSEVKAYTKPPALVETVMQAVMIFFNRQPDWATAKRTLSEANFIQQIKSFDKDNISQSTTNKIRKYIEMPQFKPEEVRKVSGAASALCSWVHAIFLYASVAREVAPKRQRLKEASESLALKQIALKDAQDALAIVTAKVASLQVSYDNSVNQKNQLREEADNLEAKLDRADKLVNGLAGEYTRWQASITEYNTSLIKVTGDSLLAAAFLSYAGPFESSYRSTLLKSWTYYINQQKIPLSENFDFIKFLAKPTDVRDWNIQGLPKDDFSTENGVISTRGSRWPLMIDPQGQANRWIRNKEGASLKIIDLKMNNYLREVENAIQYGLPILLQDILEEIDPALEPVLSKSILKVGNRSIIRVGDKEIDYSPDFKLYITTKLSNPHYTPEISTKATVVNFAVKKDGLEAQLLGIVVLKEEEKLETQKSELTIMVAKGKRQLVELEDEILRLLNESKGSLLDDEFLVNTLQKSKITAEEVTKQLIIAEETEKKIDIARSGYRPAAIRAALAYFVLDDMSRVDPMYQFSLDSYISLFKLSIDHSKTSSLDIPVAKRCDDINTYHTLAVYKYTCRGLFESHKLLFSLQLCFKIMESQGNLNYEEFGFFSTGPSIIPSSSSTTLSSPRASSKNNTTQHHYSQRSNPAVDWLPMVAWDTICELDKLSGFQGIATSFEQLGRDWKLWYMSSKPEHDIMPGDWSVKTSDLQKLCILRSLRMDRLLYGASKFIASNIGYEYVDPPSFDLKAVYDTSSCKTPLIFVLSSGVDPTAGIIQLASSLNIEVDNCALGQGQAPIAMMMIEHGIKTGKWVFLANCHLMLSWMPTLEKMITTLLIEGNPHPKFRLWLSSSPDPNFPISILQSGIKMTTEPPKGLRANLLTIYNTISEDQFHKCSQQSSYKRLLFALSWFHAILLERRKFKSLGFNICYDFNESDFMICHDLIIAFLDEYPDRIPFDAMKYLIAEANYGGRVTDDWDRRLVNVYIGELIGEECVESEKFMLSSLPDYFIPEEGDMKHYKEFIRSLPPSDHPLAFGQHVNSDMAASIEDANSLITTITSLQPRIIKAGEDDNNDPFAAQCIALLEQTPSLFDIQEIKMKVESRSDPDPLKTVLYQELDRYNRLLAIIRRTLSSIIKVTQGTVSVTAELEDVMYAINNRQVPRIWGSTYPSLKPLGSWMKDLCLRIDFFSSWAEDRLPTAWWLPAMTYPTGFLTAVLQVSARLNGVSIDSLSYETTVLTSSDKTTITAMPKDGVYVYGIFIEGSTWNFPGGYLEESRPMELISTMPIIHFKPVEGKRRAARGYYACPLYMYPIRSGSRERPSYVVTVDLKSGKFSSDFWTKRGVAMLLSTSL